MNEEERGSPAESLAQTPRGFYAPSAPGTARGHGANIPAVKGCGRRQYRLPPPADRLRVPNPQPRGEVLKTPWRRTSASPKACRGRGRGRRKRPMRKRPQGGGRAERPEGRKRPGRRPYHLGGCGPRTQTPCWARDAIATSLIDGKYFVRSGEGNPQQPRSGWRWPSPPRCASADVSHAADAANVVLRDMHRPSPATSLKAMAAPSRAIPWLDAHDGEKAGRAQRTNGRDMARKNDQWRGETRLSGRPLRPTIVEVVVERRPPRATSSPAVRCCSNSRSALEEEGRRPTNDHHGRPLALTGAWVDTDKGCCRRFTLEMGGSSDL